MNAARKPSLTLGRRYRINHQGNKADGRVGVLESVTGSDAWLLVCGRLTKAPTSCLTDKGVVQEDLSKYRFRTEVILAWQEGEQFA